MHIFPPKDLATDPSARVLVFVDGQNLYKAAKRLFGHPHCHPHLLAEYLAGPRTANRVGCRFYTGTPSRNVPGEARRLQHLDRRIAGMSSVGVSPITRQLRYHWDWGHQLSLPDPAGNPPPQVVTMRPWQRPQEKGIDLAIGLDVIEFLLTGACEVAIIVSLDRDLCEIPTAVKNLKSLLKRQVRLEAAVPVEAGLKYPKVLPGFAVTHQITPDVFDLVRDDTDYTVPAEKWTPPILPRTLGDILADRKAAAKASDAVPPERPDPGSN